ncbi:MAG: glycoside hydrolase family 13 protein [Candidatus Limiplasma sp.]|nr:glycoside hydrolase family 13 protein [Candidatus Limiplasma sp.]
MILHDSHDPAYRDPIGPVPAGGTLTVRLRCDESDAVTLRTWNGGETLTPMRRVADALYEATVPVPETPMLFWYDFRIRRADGVLRYGNAPDQLGGVGAPMTGAPRSYQVTVYDPAYCTPAFLRQGVLYQIFPDRFFRKPAAPTPAQKEAILAAHPEATFHDRWDEPPTLDPDPDNGDNRALDFFGGTLAGIEAKLDVLQALGVTALYLNPIVRARTNHRYDTGDYEAVDPILGDEAAFTALARAAASRGMRILLDGVFSHTGADSRYFNRYGRYPGVGAYQSPDSPYYGWYRFTHFPDRYDAWWGFYTLPALDKQNPDYRRYLLDPRNGVLPLWMRRGAAGWRLDVADELPVDLLRAMRGAVKGQDAEGVLLGEVWEDASNKVSYGVPRSYCLGDTLDSVMNYPLRCAVIDFFTFRTDAPALARLILHQREVYPAPFLYSLMNLLGSHDRVRALNAFAGYDREGIHQMPRDEARAVRLTPAQLELSKARYLEALRLLCALPGAPTLYYGDEMGMTGMADPWNRAPMVWDHGDATHWAAVCDRLAYRAAHPALRTGYLEVTADGADRLRIRRYALQGRDAFGDPLPETEVTVTIDRAPLTQPAD